MRHSGRAGRSVQFGPESSQFVPLHARGVGVLGEVALEGESLAAARTLVRLLARMRLNVRPEVRLVRERFAADVTAERLLPRVRSHMTCGRRRLRVRTVLCDVTRSFSHLATAMGG